MQNMCSLIEKSRGALKFLYDAELYFIHTLKGIVSPKSESEKLVGSSVVLDPIHLHCMDNIQSIFICVHQKKELFGRTMPLILPWV